MISAIISTYNRAEFLPGLFDSVLKQTVKKSEYEIVIVNNNSTDDTEKISRKFMEDHPEVNCFYCMETQQGLSYGRNRGIQESKGDLLTFLDDDAVIAPDFLEKTMLFFKSKPHVNAIGGKILLHYVKEEPAWYNPFMASLLGYFNMGDKSQVFTGNYFRGSNMSFRKKVFDKHGDFDVRLGRSGKNLFGSEEKELFYRFKEKGEEMWYVPEAIVYHLVPVERTRDEFVKKQAWGVGSSERIRNLSQGKTKFFMSFIWELMKWLASLGIAFYYLVSFKPAAARIILKFRLWVSQGLLSSELES